VGAIGFLALALGVPAVRDIFSFAVPRPELLALSVAGALVSFGLANAARHLLGPARAVASGS
jgi:hypothetical protein